jgi:glutamine synthetase
MTNFKQLHARTAALIAENDIDTIEVAFADTQGHLRGKRIPASFFLQRTGEKGFAQADASFYWSWHCELPELPHYNPGSDIVDMIVLPDLATLRPTPWRDRSALCMADCVSEHGHEPIDADPRHQLRRQIERCQARGFEPVLATELEFYLTDEAGKPVYDGIQCYSLQKGAELEHVVGHVRRVVEAFGIVVEASNTEYGPAQVEINFGHGSPMTACDDTVVFKTVVREIARNHGLRATFMAKPFPGVSGNGLHLHHSLRKEGVNVFEHADDEDALGNASMRHWVAGLTTHAAQIALLANPTVNAYKRIEDYSFAPTRVSWGLDNRNVAVRCIPQSGPASRVEYRGGAADANPYLLTAAVLAAGMDGIERELELPPTAEHDTYADERLPLLPRTLGAAIDAWEATPFARETFGERFADNYAGLARYDLTLYEAFITDWETQRYREFA